MKKNNTLKVLLIAILFTYLLTWILPISYYSSGLYTDARYPAGLFDILNYPTLTFYYFGTMALYVLVVGAFYQVFNKTGVLRNVCDKIAKLFKGKEIVFFISVVVLLSILVAFCGFTYELLFILPFLTALILLMGYDRMTVAMTLIGSIVTGFIGNLFGKSISGVYNESLGTAYTDLIWFKIALLVLGMVILIFNIMHYIKKTDFKKDDAKELLPEKITIKNKKGKIKSNWPAIVVFDLILVLMILGMLDFSGAFGIKIFENFHNTVIGFKINEYAIFSKILGSSITNLGKWTTNEFMAIMVLATMLLAIIYRIKLSDLFEDYKEGAKKFALSALLMIIAYTVLITVSNHPFLLTILNPLMKMTDGFNSVTLSISMFVASIFNIDAYYTTSTMLPYVMSIITDTDVYPFVGFISQVMQGLAMLIAPTSVVLLGVISYLKINYTTWIKNIWKMFLELFILSFILFIIINLI